MADKLGIDLVWFGVLLAINMQTSFMHPPFGFALMYLRSVASKDISTGTIYRGAVPFVAIQLAMVGLVILIPSLVYVETRQTIDLQNVRIELPRAEDDGTGAYPGTDAPPAFGQSGDPGGSSR